MQPTSISQLLTELKTAYHERNLEVCVTKTSQIILSSRCITQRENRPFAEIRARILTTPEIQELILNAYQTEAPDFLAVFILLLNPELPSTRAMLNSIKQLANYNSKYEPQLSVELQNALLSQKPNLLQSFIAAHKAQPNSASFFEEFIVESIACGELFYTKLLMSLFLQAYSFALNDDIGFHQGYFKLLDQKSMWPLVEVFLSSFAEHDKACAYHLFIQYAIDNHHIEALRFLVNLGHLALINDIESYQCLLNQCIDENVPEGVHLLVQNYDAQDLPAILLPINEENKDNASLGLAASYFSKKMLVTLFHAVIEHPNYEALLRQLTDHLFSLHHHDIHRIRGALIYALCTSKAISGEKLLALFIHQPSPITVYKIRRALEMSPNVHHKTSRWIDFNYFPFMGHFQENQPAYIAKLNPLLAQHRVTMPPVINEWKGICTPQTNHPQIFEHFAQIMRAFAHLATTAKEGGLETRLHDDVYARILYFLLPEKTRGLFENVNLVPYLAAVRQLLLRQGNQALPPPIRLIKEIQNLSVPTENAPKASSSYNLRKRTFAVAGLTLFSPASQEKTKKANTLESPKSPESLIY